ncbi:hypothetical protein [Sulfitobacter sp. R18_1]|uniref:hypothetical protein n=1 Tax=Sulfitobacter sp. R18_1 TaxID=2821104 RepID=UPI001AD9551F|nr:hypothetical protein [Sulfitobacter sp. R18_1]MBO9428760.1 hypothetical protein [Sulfitobacter sp. R18_1]
MSDMFDTYNRVYANSVARTARHNGHKAQTIINEKNDRIEELENDVWGWAAVASARGEVIDTLLEALDAQHGGPENNPYRAESKTKVVIPNGEREGENIQERDRIFLTSLKRIIENNCPHIGSWKSLIRKISVI